MGAQSFLVENHWSRKRGGSTLQHVGGLKVDKALPLGGRGRGSSAGGG